MKYIVVFLIMNVLLLSSIQGMANIHFGKATCCKQISRQDCGKQSKHHSDDDCDKGICNTMVCCGTCYFVAIATIPPSPGIADLSNEVIHPYVTGELSDYYTIDWNPPKD
jgi:hypothetical protein